MACDAASGSLVIKPVACYMHFFLLGSPAPPCMGHRVAAQLIELQLV